MRGVLPVPGPRAMEYCKTITYDNNYGITYYGVLQVTAGRVLSELAPCLGMQGGGHTGMREGFLKKVFSGRRCESFNAVRGVYISKYHMLLKPMGTPVWHGPISFGARAGDWADGPSRSWLVVVAWGQRAIGSCGHFMARD